MKVQVETLKPHRYHVQRSPGDVYVAEKGHLKLLKAMGWVRELGLVAGSAVLQEKPKPATPALRRYKRRDMVAEK